MKLLDGFFSLRHNNLSARNAIGLALLDGGQDVGGYQVHLMQHILIGHGLRYRSEIRAQLLAVDCGRDVVKRQALWHVPMS